MSPVQRNAKMRIGWAIGLVCLVGLVGVVWGLSRTEKMAQGKSERKFSLEVDFDKFRQILVRTNATAAIVEHGGMKLIDEKTEGIDIDLSNDDRPLRNALLGKSKAEVSASKRLTVQLVASELSATQILLNQDTQIRPGIIHVRTVSVAPAGELKSYQTTLDAVQASDRTEVTLSVDMTIGVRVLRLFMPQAERRVQQAADRAVQEQESAIRSLVSRFADKSMIMPKIGN